MTKMLKTKNQSEQKLSRKEASTNNLYTNVSLDEHQNAATLGDCPPNDECSDRKTESSIGSYLLPLICPYCHAALIKRQKWLLCRYHKIGFEILNVGVNFQWNDARRPIEDLLQK